MKKVLLLIVFFLPIVMMAQQTINIIPQPVSLKAGDGSFLIDKNATVQFAASNQDLKKAADFFVAAISNISGLQLGLNHASAKKIQLKLMKDAGLGNEGYTVSVQKNEVLISANTRSGIVYGMQSILQTLPAIRTNAPLDIPCMEIRDYPRFAWRGMHLDVSRHFFGPEIIKEYIRLMAAYKMNTFHWHLVDDQGWRIEIKKYPLLTQVGAWRADKTNLVWGSRPQAVAGEPANYGGYYTQDQIKEIIRYAADRNVTIVPEIEMPGHMASAIAAYPQLSCTQQAQLPMTGGNYKNISSNYCAGNDSVFSFLQNVLTEVIDLFPSTYIHVGGDEVDKSGWKKCARCQARIQAEGLKNEEELQSYFMKRIEKFIVSKKRKMIGWDEILEGGLAPTAAVMSWRGESGGIEAANMKHNVVMTPGKPCYFDHYQAGPDGEPLAIGGMNTLKIVYDYEPIPQELNAEGAAFVMGAQANLWTEFVTTAAGVEYMILPRMLALAEVVWSKKESRDWNSFNQRLQPQFKSFEQQGLNYCKGDFTVTIKPRTENGMLKVALSNEAQNSSIYYTLDGTDPSLSATKYTEPFTISSSSTVKAVTVINGTLMSAKFATQRFELHKAVGKSIVYENAASKYYPADGPNTLIDGIRGGNAHGKSWHGFDGKNLVATVDLGKEEKIHGLDLGCFQSYGSWIFLPSSVSFESSLDGVNFTTIQNITNDISPDMRATIVKDFKAQFAEKQARYVRVTARVLQGCPQGHPGEGKPAWLFADEIVIE